MRQLGRNGCVSKLKSPVTQSFQTSFWNVCIECSNLFQCLHVPSLLVSFMNSKVVGFYTRQVAKLPWHITHVQHSPKVHAPTPCLTIATRILWDKNPKRSPILSLTILYFKVRAHDTYIESIPYYPSYRRPLEEHDKKKCPNGRVRFVSKRVLPYQRVPFGSETILLLFVRWKFAMYPHSLQEQYVSYGTVALLSDSRTCVVKIRSIIIIVHKATFSVGKLFFWH